MSRNGFTLLETVVALVIIALVVTAGLRAGVMSVAATERVETGTLALWVAQNRIAEHKAGLAQNVSFGESTQGAKRFLWRESINPPVDGFRRIDVTVAETVTPDHVLATLSGYVEAPQ